MSEAVRRLTTQICEGGKEQICCGTDESAWERHVLKAAAGLQSCHIGGGACWLALLAGLPGTPLYEHALRAAGITLVQTDCQSSCYKSAKEAGSVVLRLVSIEGLMVEDNDVQKRPSFLEKTRGWCGACMTRRLIS